MRSGSAKTTVAAACIGLIAGAAPADTPKTLWDTPDDLLEWVAVFDADAVRLESHVEGDITFVRAAPAGKVAISLPKHAVSAYDLADQPSVLDPRTHSAILLRLRHTMTVEDYGGFWYHRGGDYDPSMSNVPFFDLSTVPGDGEWHELTLRLSDSPYLDPDDEIVFIQLGPTVPRMSDLEKVEELATRLRDIPSTAYLDIDRIEFVQLDEPPPPTPTISDFHPRRARWQEEVTLTGGGFAVPPERNAVLFDDVEAEVVTGDESTLVAKATSSGSVRISVRTPGGGLAEAAEPFILLRPASKLEMVAGDGQSAPVGAVLTPLSVRLSDGTFGIPGERVSFRVASGPASLSVGEVLTDEDGIAATVPTLGAAPGVVKVEAKVYGFEPVVFTATAVE